MQEQYERHLYRLSALHSCRILHNSPSCAVFHISQRHSRIKARTPCPQALYLCISRLSRRGLWACRHRVPYRTEPLQDNMCSRLLSLPLHRFHRGLRRVQRLREASRELSSSFTLKRTTAERSFTSL